MTPGPRPDGGRLGRGLGDPFGGGLAIFGIRRDSLGGFAVRLASLLEVVPEPERVGIYRRLGDLALFLTGVFPDHTAVRALAPIDTARLLRAARLAASADDPPGGHVDSLEPAGAVALLEHLGRRWYRLACDTAPSPSGAMRVVAEVAERFRQARRVLNLVTDRHLFVLRDRWFSPPTG